MTTHVVAVLLTALAFAWFASFHRRGCDGSSCGGEGGGCGACPSGSNGAEHHHE